MHSQYASECTLYTDEESAISDMLRSDLGFTIRPAALAPQAWHLVTDAGRLLLRHPDKGRIRLSDSDVSRRTSAGRKLPLAKACGLRSGLRVHDAFAGWGSDGLALARMGASVSMSELSCLVHAMLVERCRRCAAEIVPARMGAADWLRAHGQKVDVVYLDPLFPDRSKAAKPSLRMQALADVGARTDPLEAFSEARLRAAERVVVKRRRHDPDLSPDPDWRIGGRTVRFDVYRTRPDQVLANPSPPRARSRLGSA